jgi:hypothetical protein
MLYVHFDMCNDALLGLMSSLAGHEGAKVAFLKGFYCNDLVGQTLFVVISLAMKMSCRWELWGQH